MSSLALKLHFPYAPYLYIHFLFNNLQDLHSLTISLQKCETIANGTFEVRLTSRRTLKSQPRQQHFNLEKANSECLHWHPPPWLRLQSWSSSSSSLEDSHSSSIKL